MEQDNQGDRGISPARLSSPGPPALPWPSRLAATPGAPFPGPVWSAQPRRGWGSDLRPLGKETRGLHSHHCQGLRSWRHPLTLPVLPTPPAAQLGLGYSLAPGLDLFPMHHVYAFPPRPWEPALCS